ncbi:protein NUCLEAR FUSION DEFECTIVE 4-like [Cucurbita pepo subsp. pepo]|uniref:protein NUCLEAR FUSION DEFECTIVE 4-like n=1 Tax=Cucurbita pepo subsp. pepo TaxID=3664 RepID=UPI000C9D3B37|nr:protein NUCLEAR FUSION DEFECTIVE 4-like [Cucurbita pepo subsp. pepo]
MAGQSRKWLVLVATIWIQAFTGTNFDFSAYSSRLKSVLGISQVQLNYLATASDLGKVFGWSSGLALLHLPLPVVLFIAAFLGLIGYGFQWLLIADFISLPYFLVFFLCLLAGCSICWFNTVCFVLCIRNFSANRPLALSLTVSFNGVSAAFYTLAGNAINPSSPPIYLLLNALIPLLTSIAAFLPVLHQPPLHSLSLSSDAVQRDSLIFLILNFLAVAVGIYLLLFGSVTSADPMMARLLFIGAIVLLVLPLCIPGVVYANDWFHRTVNSSFSLDGSSFILVHDEDLEFHKELLSREANGSFGNGGSQLLSESASLIDGEIESKGCFPKLIEKDQLAMLGEEHPSSRLVKRLDFWLYFTAYICGGTIGLVYSNNIGQIAQSLGLSSRTNAIVTLYSSFSFFGRLLSAVPDYIRAKLYFARTGWLSIALIPTPIAFFLLSASSSTGTVYIGTALIGLSSGFIFAAAVSITAELFGPNSLGVNHNILITNIPIGSLLYGMFAAVVYDSQGRNSGHGEAVVCMGRRCYFLTFVFCGCISVVGLVSSVLLFLRTRHAYDHFESSRISSSSSRLY